MIIVIKTLAFSDKEDKNLSKLAQPLHSKAPELIYKEFKMKSVILASLFLLPQAHAACTYDVAPIRALFNSIDTSPSFEGPRTERERLSDGTTEVRRTNGGWFVREVAVDHWRFLGEFCPDSFCEDSEMHFRIIDGCLKLGPTGDTDVTVNTATSRRLDYSLDIGGLDANSRSASIRQFSSYNSVTRFSNSRSICFAAAST